jgi:hypothetical protein
MLDAGGGVFVIVLLALSFAILALWFKKGGGSRQWKVKFVAVYFGFTVVPCMVFSWLGSNGFYPVASSNISFVFGLLAVISGFIVPVVAKGVHQRANYT